MDFATYKGQKGYDNMATREENLKKINDELEKLDDEQLDKVAGGTFRMFETIGMFDQNPNTDNDSNRLDVIKASIK